MFYLRYEKDKLEQGCCHVDNVASTLSDAQYTPSLYP
jgi:hypothetical protein